MVNKSDNVRIAIYLPSALHDRIAQLQESMKRSTGLPNIPLSAAACSVIQRGLDEIQGKAAPVAIPPI